MVQRSNRLFSLTPAVASHGHGSLSSHFSLSKRSGLIIAGVFILALVVALIVSNRSVAKPAVHNASQNSPGVTNLQSSSNVNTPSSAPADNSASAGVSTDVSSTSTNGNTSTNVTVNGQPVTVPTNGSVSKDVGNAQVNVSHSQTSQGSSTNLNVSSTSLNVHSSSNTSVEVNP